MRNLILTCTYIMFFLWATAHAAAVTPSSCNPVDFKVEHNDIILSGTPQQPKTSQIYFFTNKSKQSIFIDHPVSNPGASAGWSSYIRPGNWSALVLNKKNFAVRCVMIQPGKVVNLNCSETISVCAPKTITSKKTLKGNFWLAEDKPWDVFLKAMEKRGVTFS